MSEEFVRNLFDQWERVWHEGQYSLVAGCGRRSKFGTTNSGLDG